MHNPFVSPCKKLPHSHSPSTPLPGRAPHSPIKNSLYKVFSNLGGSGPTTSPRGNRVEQTRAVPNLRDNVAPIRSKQFLVRYTIPVARKRFSAHNRYKALFELTLLLGSVPRHIFHGRRYERRPRLRLSVPSVQRT